jgi:hypothetical protein
LVTVFGAVMAGAVLAGCGIAASTDAPAPSPTIAIPSYSPAIAETRRQVAAALAASSLQLQDATQPFRPPESPTTTTAIRGVFQVILPSDPIHGYIVVYEFRDPATAAAAGAELAAYLGTGPGRIQFTPDTQHLIRLVGTTLVTYSWSPANSSDSRADAIPGDLETLGSPVAVPQ